MKQYAGPLKALDATEEFGRQSDIVFERLNKAPLAQADMLSACMTELALTAICVDVRCARKCMTSLRIGTKT